MKQFYKWICACALVSSLINPQSALAVDPENRGKTSATTKRFTSYNLEGLIGITEESPVDNPVDNIFHVNVNELLCGEEKVWLVYDLEGVEDHTSVSRSINDQIAVGGYLVKRRRGWIEQREQIGAVWLKEGDNVVRFTTPENAQHSYRIRNLRFEVEASKSSNNEVQIIFNQPSLHYFYDKAYIKGFISGVAYNSVKINIDGKEARIFNGEFESIIDFKAIQNSCSVEAEATYADGTTTCHSITFSEPQSLDFNYTLENYTYRTEKLFEAKDSGTITLNGATLQTEAEALKDNAVLSITSLRSVDIPALDGGMVNVTKNHAGFRFLPHGTVFNKEVRVTIPFDLKKLPDGYTEQDIRTYYFDEQSHHWVAVSLDTLLTESDEVVSKTLHFTDYINAIIKVPESPEVEAYNSTSIKGIKAANPTAAVDFINPPQANTTGSASLSYPINIPSGRKDLHPQLTIAYNSGGGNGWLGLGWNLTIPAISIDTRWGVPRFDPDKETETYSLNGELLTPVAHRGTLEDRYPAGKQFYPRVEGAFQRIKRYGDTPENYWWEVTDKSGTKYFYGAEGAGRSMDASAVLTDNEANKPNKSHNIAYWALREVRDVNGNTVRYHYFKQPDAGLTKGTEPGHQIYIQKISYTGFQGGDGPYWITFKRDRDLGLTKRKDISIAGNLGFKQVTADLLSKIEIKFGDKMIRSYQLIYKEGAFYKKLLETITEYDAADKPFTTHTFEYYNDVASSGKLFGGLETWNPQSDNVQGSMKSDVSGFTDEATVFSGTKSNDLNVGVTVSVGLGGNVATKLNSVGGSFGYSQSKSEGVLSMIDVNGDGLQDKLFLVGNQLVYRPNKSGTTANQIFGDTIHIKGMDLFHKEKSKTFNIGVEANALNAIMAGGGGSKTTSKTTIYFTEANGDQLIDIVKNGVVYFNHINPTTGRISYSKLSAGTPSTIEPGSNVSGDLIDREAEKLEIEKAIDENPLHDIVRMWRAPYSGTVSIAAPVQLLQSDDPDRTETPADGVRVTIQLRDDKRWDDIIEANDIQVHTPNNVANLTVQKDDRIYFRVGSRDNGSYDSVRWSPVIEYANQDLQQKDANRKALYKFEAENDFVLSASQNINPPINGTVKITGTWAKPLTTDDIDLYLLRSVDDAIKKDTLWHKQYKWNENVSINLDTAGLAVKDNEQYYFKVVSSTNVDWPHVQWKPKMTYTNASDPEIDVIKTPIEVIAVPEYSLFSYVRSISKPLKIDLQDVKKDTLKITPRLKFADPPVFAQPFTGEITFSVKKLDTLISKRVLKVEAGKIISRDTMVSVPVRDEDEIFVEYHASNLYLISGITKQNAYVKGKELDTQIVTGFHSTLPKTPKSEEIIFGPLYRGWGLFAWNGNRDWATQRIDEDLLKPSDQIKAKSDSKPNVDGLANNNDGRNISGSDTYEANKDRFIILVASGNDQRWNGYDPYVNLNALYMSSSRMGEDDLSALTFNTGDGSGARAIDKISKSTSLSYTIGISSGGFGVTSSKSESRSNVLTDYVDMNGDRYPDIVSEKIIQYTAANGGLSEKTLPIGKDIQKTEGNTTGISLSGSGGVPTAKFRRSPKGNPQPSVDAGDARTTNGGAKVTGNVNASAVDGTNSSNFVWMDMNGDGLPDKVNQADKKVALNVGYAFLEPEIWDFEFIQEGQSSTKTGGAGLGINKGNNSFSLGFSLARSDNWTNSSLQDVNGDGLPDIVKNGNPVTVYLNMGSSFADEPISWTGATAINENETASESGNLSFTVGFTILAVKFTVTPSVSLGNGMSREKKKLSDIDGDGYPDFITSNKDNNLIVYRSTIGRTNLLKGVKRPMGASFSLAYKRHGNTYEMPNSIWALDSVKMFDGFKNDGVDYMVSSFQYEGGFHDRHERDFYGFRKVVTNTHDTEKPSKPIYTTLTQTFSNDNYYEKGLLLTEIMTDGTGYKFTGKENNYKLKNIHDGFDLPASIKGDAKGNAFPALIETTQKFYEGLSEAGKSTRMTYGYSAKGNVTSYTDFGDEESEDDDISAEISYHTLESRYVIDIPQKIIVTGSGAKYRHRESVIDENTGDIKQIKQFLSDTEIAIYDMEYDEYGNLKKIIRPKNAKGKRLSLEYEYDKQVNTYTSKVTNSYGYSSESTYDVMYGQLLSKKDLSGNEIKYELDKLGRVISVTGPYEKVGANKTIEFEYYPNDAIPWALTKHFDPADPKNKLQTVIFVDGLGRVLQTKKDVAIFGGEGKADTEMMTVSGRIYFDAFRRIVKTFYPVTAPLSTFDQFINDPDNGAKPTVTTYDVLNRPLKVTLPDLAEATTAYGFEIDRNGKKRFSTKTIDANGKQVEQFTDVRGLVMAVKVYTSEKPIWTSFNYNAINEQIEATDDLGHTTFSVYDNLGRRIERRHPDAGTTTYRYDLAGNQIELVTAKLAKDGQAILFAYDFERLIEIAYPQNPENNVKYTYGESGASDYRAGRIVLQEDATGAQEFFYGRLGEIVKNIRTVVIPQHDEQTYVTEWQYDTWSRLTSMTYADGEIVTYTYNQGGLLRSMTGKKKSATYNYINQLGYDKFEQRVFLAYGNGTKSTYTYEPDRRRLDHLTSQTSAKRLFMDNTYVYDKMNNILSLKNNAPIPSPNLMGGSSEYTYNYDDLYRLTSAQGSFKGANDSHTYTLSMGYNSVGGITNKTQIHNRKDQEQKKTTYNLAYTYGETQPHAPIHIGKQAYSYDANGNQTGWTDDVTGQRRKIMWDEENRIRAIYDNGALYHYTYDASGERVLKGQSTGQRIFVNGEWKAGSGQMGNYTIYLNPYLVLKSGGYTKHYYIEGQRIVSKLGGGWDNNGKGPLKAGNGKIDYTDKGQRVFDGIVKNLKFLGAEGQILTAGKSGKVPPGQVNGSGNITEAFRYFYHPDHLGSTSYVTDASGEVYQHIEYFAFGETFVEEHSNTDRTPYLFNGKELDEETGLYYYGARYYDPRSGIFQSVDPLADKFASLSPYQFAGNQVPNAVDLDGLEPSRSDGFIPPWLLNEPKAIKRPEGWHPPMSADYVPPVQEKMPEVKAVTDKNAGNISKVSWGETQGIYPTKDPEPGSTKQKPSAKEMYNPSNWDPAKTKQLLKARAAIDFVYNERNKAAQTDNLDMNNKVEKTLAPYHLKDNFPDVDPEIKNDNSVKFFYLGGKADSKHTGIDGRYWNQKVVKSYGPFYNAGGGDAKPGPIYINFYSITPKE